LKLPTEEILMNDQNNTNAAIFILRISLGTMFIAHALLKYLVFTLPGTEQFFSSVGLPGILAYVVFIAELVGGCLLILGLHTRKVALALLPILLGAAYVHWPNGWVFSNQHGGWEYPIFLAMVTIVQAMLGDGAYTVKRLVSPAS